MNREKIFRKLYENNLKSEKYLDSIPRDILSVVFDNKYANLQSEDRSILLNAVFDEHTEAIEWFLYEWKPGREVMMGDEIATINNIDDYIEWMKKNEGFQ